MSEEGIRFSRASKLKAIERMDAGENVSALSRELGVKRTMLYRWRVLYRSGGAERFRDRRGRPTLTEAQEMAAARAPAAEAESLARAKRRIAELERRLGQQQLDLDFFEKALRHFEASRQASGAPGGTASSSSSRR